MLPPFFFSFRNSSKLYRLKKHKKSTFSLSSMKANKNVPNINPFKCSLLSCILCRNIWLFHGQILSSVTLGVAWQMMEHLLVHQRHGDRDGHKRTIQRRIKRDEILNKKSALRKKLSPTQRQVSAKSFPTQSTLPHHSPLISHNEFSFWTF